MAAEQDERTETCLTIDISQGTSIPDGAVRPASGHVPMGGDLKGLVIVGRARLGRKARADRLGPVDQVIDDRRREAGDSTPRASRTVVPSAPGRGAAQDAPANPAGLVLLTVADLVDLDRGHAPADLAGHVPPAAVDLAGLDLMGRARFATQNRADLKASEVRGRARDPAASAGHVPPGRALAAGRRGHPRVVLTTASPIAAMMVSRARQGANGDPPKVGLRGRPDPTGAPRVGTSTHRSRGLTGNGTRVQAGRALARAQISVADRARRGPASGSVAADHQARPCAAGNSRSVSTETPMRPTRPI
jgi:hypothetical protein